jgi:Ca2+:H+ antiporter
MGYSGIQEINKRRVDANHNRNGAEMCFAIIAVIRGESIIAQTALTGSLLSGCLMVFGTSLLFGGLQNEFQFYPVVIARAHAQLLVVSLSTFVLPTAFKSWSQSKLITASQLSWLSA